MAQVLQHMKGLGLNPQTVIDVGVGHGTSELYDSFPNAEYLLIEAVREFEPDLKQILSHRKGRYLLAAAGAQPGETTINVHPEHLQGSSLFNESDGADGMARTIPVVTIDSANASGSIVIKLDIQGAELLALSGATETMKRTEAILMEVALIPCLKDIPLFAEVIRFMADRGFVVYDFFGGGQRPLDGAMASADLVFVQENGKFRQNHAWAAERVA